MLPGYPKVMKHPAFVKGIAQEVPPKNYKGDKTDWFPGTADRFPDITVTNPDQQEWHESRGYVAVDGSTIIGTPVNQTFQEYPKWIRSPEGNEVLVESIEQESQVMGHNVPGERGSPTLQQRKEAIFPKRHGGRPKGSKNRPKTDHMKVND